MKVTDLAKMISVGPRGVDRLNTYADFEKVAKRRLPRMVYDFVAGGADGEVTLRANREAFDRVRWAPRFLSDVSGRDITTSVLGQHLEVPFVCGPAGLARLVHREGELAVARAAGKAGTVFVVSTGSSYSLEEIADAATGPVWFQLYLWKSSEVVKSLVERARASGYEALVLTIDVPAVGKRERDFRNGFTLPPRIRMSGALDTSWRFWWLYHLLTGPEVNFGSLVEIVGEGDVDVASVGVYVDRELNDPTKTWEDLAELRRMWDGPLLVKGVMTAHDAKHAVDNGADGVIVSNHGGRQLDSVPGALEVLPEVVDMVGDRAEVILDGGVRRGEDIVKAKALGASATMGGRPWFWGLCAGGEAGVTKMLDVFKADVVRTLALIGVPRYDDVDQTSLRDD